MLRSVRNYIDGRWREAGNQGYLDVENPSTGEILAKVPLSTDAEFELAVTAARNAFPAWSTTPVARRCEPLYRLAELIRDQGESLARTISEEMGKSLPDAKAEIKRSLENCRVACGHAQSNPRRQRHGRGCGNRRRSDSHADRRIWGDCSVQFPIDGPFLVPSLRLGHRQHVHSKTLGAGAR